MANSRALRAHRPDRDETALPGGAARHAPGCGQPPSFPMPPPSENRVGVDAFIMRLAATQHGIVTRAQLLEAGITEHQIRHRRRIGVLEKLHASVYRASALTSPEERRAAALLSCGPGAVLSFRSAAAVLRICPQDADAAAVDVTVSPACRLLRHAVRIHRSDSLDHAEVTIISGMRVTTAARTLLDLAAVYAERDLEQALATALRLDLTTSAELGDVLNRHSGAKGIARLRALHEASSETAFVRSEAESRFLSLVRAAGLSAPECNVRLRGFEVDFLWRAARLVAEIDGFAFHATREAFERDRRRDTALEAAGFRVLRFTWRQVTREPFRVIAQVAETLGRCAPL
jgi:very-short-patch-repair endonuclease